MTVFSELYVHFEAIHMWTQDMDIVFKETITELFRSTYDDDEITKAEDRTAARQTRTGQQSLMFGLNTNKYFS